MSWKSSLYFKRYFSRRKKDTLELIAYENEAKDAVEEQYKNGEIVLDYEDHIETSYSTWKVEELESEKKENEEI